MNFSLRNFARSPTEEMAFQRRGIDNWGNTCFANSVMQCLASSLIDGTAEALDASKETTTAGQRIAWLCSAVARNVCFQPQSAVATGKSKQTMAVRSDPAALVDFLFSSLKETRPDLVDGAQHDADEFCTAVLDMCRKSMATLFEFNECRSTHCSDCGNSSEPRTQAVYSLQLALTSHQEATRETEAAAAALALAPGLAEQVSTPQPKTIIIDDDDLETQQGGPKGGLQAPPLKINLSVQLFSNVHNPVPVLCDAAITQHTTCSDLMLDVSACCDVNENNDTGASGEGNGGENLILVQWLRRDYSELPRVFAPASVLTRHGVNEDSLLCVYFIPDNQKRAYFIVNYINSRSIGVPRILFHSYRDEATIASRDAEHDEMLQNSIERSCADLVQLAVPERRGILSRLKREAKNMAVNDDGSNAAFVEYSRAEATRRYYTALQKRPFTYKHVASDPTGCIGLYSVHWTPRYMVNMSALVRGANLVSDVTRLRHFTAASALSVTPTQTSGSKNRAFDALKRKRTVNYNPPKLPLNLQVLIDEQSTQIETLEADNWWFCDKCNAKKPSYRECTHTSVPDNLYVSLKRFTLVNFATGQVRKDRRHVHIASHGKVGSTNIVFFGKEYALRGAVMHHGTPEGGHYTALVELMPNTGVYAHVNDELVTPVANVQAFLNRYAAEVYLLFYKKVGLAAPP